MRLEDMKDTFPKMPEDIKNMIEKEVAVQIKSRQEESMDPENARQSGKTEDKENAKVIKYRKKKKDAARRMLVASMVAALALATVKYENNGTETLHDIMYNGGIAFLEEKGSQMQFADYFLLSDEEKASIGCDYRELERVGFSQEVYLSDVTGGERNNNYINELKPGESVTVHFAFKIPEEKLGEMYLTLSNTGGAYSYDETCLAVGYVDIRQK